MHNLSEQKNHLTSPDKRIAQPAGKKNANSWDKKKQCHLLGRKKTMQPLKTKKIIKWLQITSNAFK